MVKTEAQGNFTRTYSDKGFKIRQDGTGIIYDEAVDPADSGRTYTETDEPVEDTVTAEDLLAILTGGAE
ncbi:MAG: hypothetical protein IJ126_08415 [Lachnospiraceae bacterium]|nr:hypothetical protein [Lachnospiraceae bacterium]